MDMRHAKSFKYAGFLLLGVGCLLVAIYLYDIVDEPPPADDDLRLQRANVPRGQNGFYLIQLKAEDIWLGNIEEDKEGRSEASVVHDMIWGQIWEPKLAERVLNENREALDKLDLALQAMIFEAPEYTSVEVSIPHVSGWSCLCCLLLLRARLELEAGREESAFAQAMKVVRFGQRIQSCKGVPTEVARGWQIQEAGLGQIQRFLGRARGGLDALKKHLSDLSGCYTNLKVVEDVLKSCYAVAAHTIDAMSKGEVSMDLLLLGRGGTLSPLSRWLLGLKFNPNATKRLFAEATRAVLEELAKPPVERNPIDFDALSGGRVDRWFFGKNVAGRLWLQTTMPSTERTALEYLRANVQVSFTRALIALRCHQISKGALPASLEELIPEYFEHVPVDPYDGKPLRYSREKKVLWSVGKDFEDSQGSQKADQVEALDDEAEFTCRIEF